MVSEPTSIAASVDDILPGELTADGSHKSPSGRMEVSPPRSPPPVVVWKGDGPDMSPTQRHSNRSSKETGLGTGVFSVSPWTERHQKQEDDGCCSDGSESDGVVIVDRLDGEEPCSMTEVHFREGDASDHGDYLCSSKTPASLYDDRGRLCGRTGVEGQKK